MQASHPYQNRLFSPGQWNHAIAGSIPVNLAVVVPSP